MSKPSNPVQCEFGTSKKPAFGKLLPLRKASAFGQREMVRLLLDRSEGITGRTTRLISRAAAEAIQDGSELVTIERIDEISRRSTIVA